jgi:hypothetical protein
MKLLLGSGSCVASPRVTLKAVAAVMQEAYSITAVNINGGNELTFPRSDAPNALLDCDLHLLIPTPARWPYAELTEFTITIKLPALTKFALL